ncbi:SAP domain-containing protein [Paenibacillus sp. UNC451MF]|uniref:SAP domain-containing protein n=1 Tax=Paenibacillus sp. UNC451MF TaxID=1449063 RepID=UPI00056C517A|nr:SAP domain-containing protein [Paenibacillus sp. UNC451MF]
MSIKRPEFSLKLSVQEFENHYWYKTDLVDICRMNLISSSGTKAELERRIKKLLNGETIEDERKTSTTIRKKQQGTEISLQTKLIPDGFKFNAKAREFFAQYYKLPKFSFTKDMAAALREAERQGDMEMTVADLILIHEGKKGRASEDPEEKTYQWNRFVKDFNKDPQSNLIKEDRMKVAAELWKIVRDSPGAKQYSPQLLENYLKN